MKVNVCISKEILHFSRWCGKGYAIFAALGREVRISGLAVHICECALLKSAHKSIITNMDTCCYRDEQDITDKWSERYEIFCFDRGEVCPDAWCQFK